MTKRDSTLPNVSTMFAFGRGAGCRFKSRPGVSVYELTSDVLEKIGHPRLGMAHKEHCRKYLSVIQDLAKGHRKQRTSKQEKRAALALEKQIRMHDGAARETWRHGGKKANEIAKSIKNVTATGVSVSSNEFLQTYEWRTARMVALKKYGPVCQCCGASPATGAVMNVDHIKPRKLFPHLALDVDNLQILCGPCNMGKGNWDTTDWRPAEDPPELIRLVRDIGYRT